MNCTSFVAAAVLLATFCAGLSNADVVTSDFTTIADGRVQFSGALGHELFTAEEDILTLRSGNSNQSDGLYEFDLAAMPADADIISAEIIFRTAAAVTNTSTSAPVEFFGFVGNGSLELSDEAAAATSLGTIDFTTAVGNDTEISAAVANLVPIETVLGDGNLDDFFTLRSETINFVTLNVDSLESSDPNAMAATLRLTYETSAVPEPSSMAIIGLGVFGFVLRRRR
jgi:hypothetical protein